MPFNFDKAIALEDNRVKLSPLIWEHFDEMLPISLKNPALLQYSPSKFGTKESLKAYFQSAFDLKQKQLRYSFAIFDKMKNSYAGSTSFGNISNKDLRIEIGWTWLGKDFQRTGLNRHCKFLLLQYVFEGLMFERVELKTDSRNEQSRKAIEAIGGKYEGELRSHTLMPNGFRRNTVYYSILKDEWNGIKVDKFKNR
ncbi:MAG: GNAT family protein [Bacteroidota bacterium]